MDGWMVDGWMVGQTGGVTREDGRKLGDSDHKARVRFGGVSDAYTQLPSYNRCLLSSS